MQEFLNIIGAQLLSHWDWFGELTFNLGAVKFTALFAAIVIIGGLSIIGVWSRLTDFILNSTMVYAVLIFAGTLVGIMLTDTATTILGSIVLITAQSIVLLGLTFFLVLGAAYTLIAVYRGKNHSSLLQFFG